MHTPTWVKACFSLAAMMTMATTASAQSDMDRRNTEVVQSVYLRTLSVTPSEDLVREAQNALDMAVRSYGATDGRTADMAFNLGRALNDTEQFNAATSVLQSALSIYSESRDDTKLRAAVTRYELGRALAGTGDTASAITSLTEAYVALEPAFRQLSSDSRFIRETIRQVGGADAVSAAQRQARSAPAYATGSQPKATVRIPPIYPPDAPDTKGWVLIDYRLWPDGAVRDVMVLAADPPGAFDISAAMALSNWRFEPQSNGDTHYQLSIVFDQRN